MLLKVFSFWKMSLRVWMEPSVFFFLILSHKSDFSSLGGFLCSVSFSIEDCLVPSSGVLYLLTFSLLSKTSLID